MGYKFQFVTLAGFHSLNYSMFELSHGYGKRGMAAYSELQQREFGAEKIGYTATKCAPSPADTVHCVLLMISVVKSYQACVVSLMPNTVSRSRGLRRSFSSFAAECNAMPADVSFRSSSASTASRKCDKRTLSVPIACHPLGCTHHRPSHLF